MNWKVFAIPGAALFSMALAAVASAEDNADPANTVTFVEAEGQWAFTLTWDPPQIWDMDTPRDVTPCGPDCIRSPFVAIRSLPDFGPERRMGARFRRGNAVFEYHGLETLSHCREETDVHAVMGRVEAGREGRRDTALDTRSYYAQDGTLIGYTKVN